jgi:CheY-like chemotaxis protein
MPPLLLLVDDAPEMAVIAQLLARRSGQEIVCKTDADSVLAWAEQVCSPSPPAPLPRGGKGEPQSKPDLLLLDLRLPGGGGIELYRFVKRNTSLVEGVPVALFTQGPSPGELAEALRAGIDFLVSKECLSDLDLWKRRIDEVLTVAANPPRPSAIPPVRLDENRLREGLARVVAHPALGFLETEGVRGLWSRAWTRTRELFPVTQEMIDIPLSSVTLTYVLNQLISRRPDVVSFLVTMLGHQVECLLGRSTAAPVQAALAAVLTQASG